jgi:hypothetical protein
VAFACFNAETKAVLPLEMCRPIVAADGTSTSVGSLHALVTQSDRGEVAAVDLSAQVVIDSREDIPGFTFVPAGELPGPIVVPPNHPDATYVANRGSRDISVLNTAAFRELVVGESATKQRVRLEVDAEKGAMAPFDMLLAPDEDALFVSTSESGLLLRLPIQRCADLADELRAGCREGEIDLEHIVVVPLEASLPQAQMPAVPMGNEEEPYGLICNPELLLPVPMAGPKQVGAAAPSPQPAGLALDAFCKPDEAECKRRLLVADKRLPIIHVVDLDALAAGDVAAAVLQPIVTGVATERVAVTPRVPVDVQKSEDETQYVYAIDATDGSVLVARDGRVLNVSSDPTARPDRLDLGRSTSGRSVALSLGIMTPAFDVSLPAAQWVEPTGTDKTQPMCTDDLFPNRTANRLRGVFLAVGLTDGTVRIVNVHDMELANCRSCDSDSALFDPYPVLRNRPRINAYYVPAPGVLPPLLTPLVAPQFEIDSDVIPLNPDGSVNDPRVSGLACRSCPSNQAVSFPAPGVSQGVGTSAGAGGSLAANGGAGMAGDAGGGAGASGMDGAGAGGHAGNAGGGASGATATSDMTGSCPDGQGRVCSLADPWIDPIDWLAAYEGAIPGARGGRGRFVEATSDDNRTGALEFAAEASFCSSGVLGSDDITPGRSGDQLEITSPAPDDGLVKSAHMAAAVRDDCLILFRARDEEKSPIAFEIKQAYQDRLVIGSELLPAPAGTRSDLNRRPLDYDFVRQCFLGMLMTYEVHVRKGYAVSSYLGATPIEPGFMHRVIRDATSGRCVIDDKQPANHSGRAYDGEVFDNGYVSFQTLRPPTEPTTRLRLRSGSATPKLILDASQVSGGVLYGVTPVALQYSDLDQSLYVVDETVRGLIPVPLSAFPRAILTSYQ